MIDTFANIAANTMKINGLSCTLNMPKALAQKTNGEKEIANALPPYNRRHAFLVDEYPACPQNWMRSSGDVSSYFVPVLSEHGMWLDFNTNANHAHDVACVISVQGVNAVTGQKTDKLRLEQYKKKCPIHNEPFGHERFCEQCGFKWPTQNYISTNATQKGLFWLDGFRTEDGEVRQYVFTEEMIRGVAAQILGDERVFAIAVAFYLSKNQKPIPAYTPPFNINNHGGLIGGGCYSDGFITYTAGSTGGSSMGSCLSSNPSGLKRTKMQMTDPITGETFWTNKRSLGDYQDASVSVCNFVGSNSADCAVNSIASASLDGICLHESIESVEPIEITKLEIAAGAKIFQQIHADAEKLTYWETKPAGIIYINYVSCEDAQKIVDAGRVKIGNPEGFLNGLKVGNSVNE